MLAYFQTVADLLTENPPPKDQEAAVILLSRGGINVGQPMDISKLDEAANKGLSRAAEMGPQIMKWKVKFRGTPYPTRWNNLRPGTYGYDYFDRAAGALEGLFVHDREEAEYFSTYEDGSAQLLDGVNKYVVHFNKDELPPTLRHGFWSFTMYGSDFQLVKNAINRFSIGTIARSLPSMCATLQPWRWQQGENTPLRPADTKSMAASAIAVADTTDVRRRSHRRRQNQNVEEFLTKIRSTDLLTPF